MKVGLRTPNPEKMIKAKTTGRMKRTAKKAVNPIYGKKGVGYIKDPERAVKNRFYHQLTVDPLEPIKDAEMPDNIPIPEHSFKWHRFMLSFASIMVIITCYKVLFANTLDLRWCLGSGIAIAVFILAKVLNV